MKNLDNSSSEQVARDAAGRVLPGKSLNPHGRPRGSLGGISRVMQMVFAVANENQERIRQALQKEARTNPTRFARQFILPATPHRYRAAFRARIREMEVAAFEKAQAPFSAVKEMGQP